MDENKLIQTPYIFYKHDFETKPKKLAHVTL